MLTTVRVKNLALVERVKELTCLHGIARAVARHDADVPSILREVVALLPPAWQYPETARARIVLDTEEFTTAGFAHGSSRQSADIVVRGRVRGKVEVVYLVPRPPADEGPFLMEERALGWIVSTPSTGTAPRLDEVRMRGHAVVRGIPITTTIDGLRAAFNGLEALRRMGTFEVCSLQEYHRHSPKLKLVSGKKS